MGKNLYKILGVNSKSTLDEIKSAYRDLVKKHHPDAGGDDEVILSINAAWEILRDPQKRKTYDQSINGDDLFTNEIQSRDLRNARASSIAKATQGMASANQQEVIQWFSKVFIPIDRLLGEIMNPFPKQLRCLSADPYDDSLMKVFCSYLEESQKRLKKIDFIYRSIPIPKFVQSLGLNLYQCLSQVEDAINELERYTMGYVDSYLNDGREMLREAKQKRKQLQAEKRRLKIS